MASGIGKHGVQSANPTGVIGFGFRAARKVYYTMQHVPVVNSLGLWRAVDRFVLEGVVCGKGQKLGCFYLRLLQPE